MAIKYSDNRDESLIWIKRKTQHKDAVDDPTLISFWPHLIVALNDEMLRSTDFEGKSFNFPFNERNIREGDESEKSYKKIMEDLRIRDFDIKNMWPRFNRKFITMDFDINEDQFRQSIIEDKGVAGIVKFVDAHCYPADAGDPKKFIQAASGLSAIQLDLIWDAAKCSVVMFAYGLVSRSFYGQTYRKRVLNSGSDESEALSQLTKNNACLLKLFSHTSDYDKRGADDAIAVVNAYYVFAKKNGLEKLDESHFQTAIIPRRSLFKESENVEKTLSYFDINIDAWLANLRSSESSIERADSDVDSVRLEPTLVILQGPPGTGKTKKAREMAATLKIQDPRICQFHPSYSYEQFVEGIQPVAFVDGTFKYQPVDGPLLISWRKVTGIRVATLSLNSAGKLHFPAGILPRYFGIGEKFHVYATKESESYLHELTYSGFDSFELMESKTTGTGSEFLLVTIYFSGVAWGSGKSELIILDELNRASVSQVFGELLYSLSLVDGEMSEIKRKAYPVRLQYSQQPFYWPDGLHLIATLNQADRSTEDLDQALQRRFEIVNVLPESSVLRTSELACIRSAIPEGKGTADDVSRWMQKNCGLVCSELSQIMDSLNDCIKRNTSVFDSEKKLIGQAIFLKVARVTAKEIGKNSSKSSISDRFLVELRTSLISQMMSICNNNSVLVADIFNEAVEDRNLKIPKEILDELMNVIPDDHPLHKKYAIGFSNVG